MQINKDQISGIDPKSGSIKIINSWNLIFIDPHWSAFGIELACPELREFSQNYTLVRNHCMDVKNPSQMTFVGKSTLAHWIIDLIAFIQCKLYKAYHVMEISHLWNLCRILYSAQRSAQALHKGNSLIANDNGAERSNERVIQTCYGWIF